MNKGATIKKNNIKGILLIFVYGLIMVIGYSIPEYTIKKFSKLKFYPSFISDPLIHIISFGLFTIILGLIIFRRSEERSPYIKLFFYSVGFGFFIELYQLILPFRGLEFFDFVWDVLGIITAIMIIFMFNLFNKMI